jgi:hypothetical protein
MKMRILLIVFSLVLVSCSEYQSETPAIPASISSGISKSEAIDIIAGLPETNAWAMSIRESTIGEVRGVLMANDRQPVTIGDNHYWDISFYESNPERIIRIESFLVRYDGAEILINDVVELRYISLEEWRSTYKPLDRYSAE